MLMCGTPYRLSLTLLFLKLYLILLPIFMKIHWGMRWSCFCFLAKNHLILKVLEKTRQEANSTTQRMADNRREMNAFQSPSCIFLALIGGGLFSISSLRDFPRELPFFCRLSGRPFQLVQPECLLLSLTQLFFGVCMCVCYCAWLFAIPETIAHQAPLSMGFPKEEYWVAISSFKGSWSNPRLLGVLHFRKIFYLLSHQGSLLNCIIPAPPAPNIGCRV